MDIGLILSSMPPIVENIFKHLTLRDLESCAHVCDLWRRIAETEKNNREDIYWFFQGLKCSVHNEVHYARRACTGRKYESMEIELSEQLKDMKLKPKYCLIFITEGLFIEFSMFFPSFGYFLAEDNQAQSKGLKKNCLGNVMKAAGFEYLPAERNMFFTVSPGVVGCHATNCEPMEAEDGFVISGLMLPSVPGLEIYNITDKDMAANLVPQNCRIKCLLVFVSSGYFSYESILKHCLERENFELALGGSFVKHASSPGVSVLAFCGENIEAASVIIKGTGGYSEVKEKLQSFQKTDLLQHRCFAFLFLPVYRGYLRERQLNFESSIFHELYPKIPVFGVFGSKQIGREYIPNQSTCTDVPSKNKMPKKDTTFCPGSSVLVLVSVKM